MNDLDTLFNKIKDGYENKNGDIKFLKAMKNEALFGFSEIEQFLKKSIKILEIGCGSGLLSAIIGNKDLNITSLEPIESGFSKTELLLNSTQKFYSNKFNLVRKTIENFDTEEKFDLIFSINVFEHIQNWNLALLKSIDMLNKNGKLIILCPNYCFPYESHFRIPIIFNKKITSIIFSKYINNYEKKYDSLGLWNSLNFIKITEIKKHLPNNVTIDFDKSILIRMVNRLFNDKCFNERQKFLGYFTKLFSKMNLHNFYTLLPMNFQPYQKIIIQKK
ncbi:MAG: Ubiquinone biosynthesis O-methyltransferase [Candidatus Anoxychlamydiales bacterium]|nr:Ubiquinone biosynthesis O-methyltransferase [Candidatus Anoxychlamydiales bacterium]